ncbi:hypothetical protein [Glycomyces terrestris]|uniref:Small CPxCG-related zinc finger protein n=1 Tax=Glycomyces terrestris TaxID=2493553 RepID=A0A426UW96_9ACTN|nr:hypothetical protein [Glycomyces terrestris]RRR98488.1 hypothetical protein EIW28_16545 [Glycomyces terrestris]
MNDEQWNEIIESEREGESGPWLCPDCDELTVELGVRFEGGAAVESTFMCNSCQASVTAPA